MIKYVFCIKKCYFLVAQAPSTTTWSPSLSEGGFPLVPLKHKSAEKARVIFRLRWSDIVAGDSDMKAVGFRDILFATKLA